MCWTTGVARPTSDRRSAPIFRRSSRRFPASRQRIFLSSIRAKPDDTDFQLQQGLAVANAMAAARNGVAAN